MEHSGLSRLKKWQAHSTYQLKVKQILGPASEDSQFVGVRQHESEASTQYHTNQCGLLSSAYHYSAHMKMKRAV
jgi:hypothetical protein